MIMPLNITFPLWAASLLVDFPTDNIPLYKEGHDWELWGDAVVQTPSFAEQGAPGTKGFSEPLEWAKIIYNVMNNFA